MDDALDVIADLLEQACFTHMHDDLTSDYISAYAGAMRFLAEHGRFNIVSDDGGRYVTGKVIWP